MASKEIEIMGNINREAHLKELRETLFENQEFLFEKITIRRNFYDKLIKISSLTRKTVEQTLENMINELYLYLKKEGAI